VNRTTNRKVLGFFLVCVIFTLVFFYIAYIGIQNQNAVVIIVFLALAQVFLSFVANAEYDMIKRWLGIKD